jgi:acylphosphatase
MSHIRKDVHFQGNVQGVGFRYTTNRIANGYDVKGYVKNLPDGRVRVVVEGSSEEVQRFLGEVRQRMSSYIHSVDEERHSATGEFQSFQVRH